MKLINVLYRGLQTCWGKSIPNRNHLFFKKPILSCNKVFYEK